MLASDSPALVQAAADGELWNLPYTVVPSAETVDSYIRTALEGRADGTAIPFVIQTLQPISRRRRPLPESIDSAEPDPVLPEEA
jgi:hypothetical protein